MVASRGHGSNMPFVPDKPVASAPGRFVADPGPKGPRVVKSLGDIVPGEREGVDYVFDKPAPAPTAQPSFGKLLLGLLDNVIPAASSFAAAPAESFTRLAGGSPEQIGKVHDFPQAHQPV